MDKLTKSERQQIRAILQDDKFRAVELFLKILKDKYRNEQVKAESEWETMWRVAQRESKVEVIGDIINGLIEQASQE